MDGVERVKLAFVDLSGRPKGVIIPASRLENAVNEGIGFDGSSVGLAGVEKSDMVATPDTSTFVRLPWENGGGMGLALCDVSTPDSNGEFCSRSILKRTVGRHKGLDVNAGTELEFFLLDKSRAHVDRSGYFDFSAMDSSEPVKLEITSGLESMGFQIDKLHHEVASSQHEINFGFSEPTVTADRVTLFKLAVKSIAAKNGMTATFMPKPFFGINGSGAHTHISVFRDGKNLFYEPKAKGLSDFGRYFIGGLLAHARGLSLLASPLVNSYKRLLPDYEAPVYIAWGPMNRSAIIRIPYWADGKALRPEYRHPDPSANFYLLYAAMIEAGFDGVKNKIEPGEASEKNLFHHHEGLLRLPETLGEAVEAFGKDAVVRAAIGEPVARRIRESKTKEWQDYVSKEGEWAKTRNRITGWELEKYLAVA